MIDDEIKAALLAADTEMLEEIEAARAKWTARVAEIQRTCTPDGLRGVWMWRNGVTVRPVTDEDHEDFILSKRHRYKAETIQNDIENGETSIAFGETEDEAIAMLGIRPLWNEDGR